MQLNQYRIPDWISVNAPEVAGALGQFSIFANEIQSRPDSYLYLNIVQAQYNAMNKQLMDAGITSMKGNTVIIANPNAVPLSHLRATIHIAVSTVPLLELFAVKSRLSLASLAQSFSENINRHRIAPAFADLRGICEHVAHYCEAIRRARQIVLPPEANALAINQYLGEIREILVQSNYATRIDWESLVQNSVPLRKRKDIVYSPDATLTSIQAKSILSAIDKLGKKVDGVRNIYEFLCEFTHPNVGTNFCYVYKAEAHSADAGGVLWKTTEIGPEVPIAFIKQMKGVLTEAIHCIADCMQEFLRLDTETSKWATELSGHVGTLTRASIKQSEDLFGPYEPCPCRSGKKVKFCCGLKN